MAIIEITSSASPITVTPGDTYVIKGSVTGTLNFEAASGSTFPVDYTVVMDESPAGSLNVVATDVQLNPTYNIGDGYTGPTTVIDNDAAGGGTVNAGNNVELNQITGSKTGDDTITFGDNAVINTAIKVGDGTDSTIDFGANADITLIQGTKGAENITIGPGSTVGEITNGDGDDTIDLKALSGTNSIKMEAGDDTLYVGEIDLSKVSKTPSYSGGSGGTDNDHLYFDTSWLSTTEKANLDAALAAGGYTYNAATDTWTHPTDSSNIKWDLDDGTTVEFKDWETITGTICFARGTRIATDRGEVAIEDLTPGDRVLTMDSGYQELRWIGMTRVLARGHLAPIRIKAGTYGNSRDVVVSPQHRVLMRGGELETLFGQTEALVAAKHLVDGEKVVVEDLVEVEYYHMLFQRHEIVYAEGMPSESFHPGVFGLDSMAEATRREIFELFPELETDVSAYGASCRTSLKSFEARVLLHGRRPEVAAVA